MNKYSIVIGRFLLGLYFLIPGIRKFTESDQMTAYMLSHEIAFAPTFVVCWGCECDWWDLIDVWSARKNRSLRICSLRAARQFHVARLLDHERGYGRS